MECLNQHWLTNLEDAEERFDDWQRITTSRPRSLRVLAVVCRAKLLSPRYARLSIRYPHVYGYQFQFDFQRRRHCPRAVPTGDNQG